MIVDELVSVLPKNIVVNESSSFVLQCEATGHPPPLISWIIGIESLIKSGSRRIINTEQINAYTVNSTLTVLNAEPSDAGDYKCKAQSDGFHIDSTSVTVIGQCVIQVYEHV